MQIYNYIHFLTALKRAGFSMGGGNSEGIYAVIPWNWEELPPYETPVRWHTGDRETDPWEWRIRVLDERIDIAYGKVFFKKSGFITKEWYPYFLAARRGGRSFEDAYSDGCISFAAKRIFEVIKEYEPIPLHTIKQLSGFSKEDKSQFDRALTELQMMLFITMCGKMQKMSKKGEDYGWSSTVFCTTELFWGDEIFNLAKNISKKEAIEKISDQVLKLNPQAKLTKIQKFIKG